MKKILPDIKEIIMKPKSCIIFKNEGHWFMKIEHGGKIIFNREEFPTMTEDQFANKILDILSDYKWTRHYLSTKE